MSIILDYNIERENNIIKNIALEIVAECAQVGLEVTPELANYMVKIKLLNPKNGFTASEVMPRNLTQQLVASVVENLKLFTPSMNCIRMQVFWNSLDLNIAHLKSQFIKLLSEKANPYLNEIILWCSKENESFRIYEFLSSYILVSRNLGNVNHPKHFNETMAAVYSVFKDKHAQAMINLTHEKKIMRITEIADRVTGIRLFLKHTGRAGEGIEEVRNLFTRLESTKNEVLIQDEKVTTRIEDLRKIIISMIPMDFLEDVVEPGEVNLPPDSSLDDFKYLKTLLNVMLQYSFYLSDLLSKLEEIDGIVNVFFKEFKETLQKLQETIKSREAVPTSEVYDNFNKVGKLYLEIQSYSHCLNFLQRIIKKLDHLTKKHYFTQTKLEKLVLEKINRMQPHEDAINKSPEDAQTFSTTLVMKGTEAFTVEFKGFCALTIFYTEGLLLPGVPEAGIFQYKDQYFVFADKRWHEIWAKNPEFYLMEIYELLRNNPEMIDLLNAYDNLYYAKTQKQVIKIHKTPKRTEDTQTVLHPIEEYWDKDYAFSIWELKKQTLTLSRLVKCVTKSVQTFDPQSHYRASIGLLAAPDKDKEVQTKRDSSCVHSTISNYLYGLRGHREDKFRVVELTRPIEEIYEKTIILEEGKPCKQRREKRINDKPYPPLKTYDKCDCYDGGELSDQCTQQL